MQDNQKQHPRTKDDALAEKAHETARKIEMERPFKRNPEDPADNTTGGFNQKSRVSSRQPKP